MSVYGYIRNVIRVFHFYVTAMLQLIDRSSRTAGCSIRVYVLIFNGILPSNIKIMKIMPR